MCPPVSDFSATIATPVAPVSSNPLLLSVFTHPVPWASPVSPVQRPPISDTVADRWAARILLHTRLMHIGVTEVRIAHVTNGAHDRHVAIVAELSLTCGQVAIRSPAATRRPRHARRTKTQAPQIISFFVSQRITGQPMNTGSQQVSTR